MKGPEISPALEPASIAGSRYTDGGRVGSKAGFAPDGWAVPGVKITEVIACLQSWTSVETKPSVSAISKAPELLSSYLCSQPSWDLNYRPARGYPRNGSASAIVSSHGFWSRAGHSILPVEHPVFGQAGHPSHSELWLRAGTWRGTVPHILLIS